MGWAAVMTAAALTVAACGASETPSAPAPAVTTTTPSPASTETTPATAGTTAAAPKAAKIEVPVGVGLDYQSAQDLWRAAGLHVAPAKDATGANRLPVIDSNWIVVSQDPKGGSTVEAGSFITATVKKDSDG
jgi:beta-lactam-binding protein with PASTA domain